MQEPLDRIGGRHYYRRKINGIAWTKITEDGRRAGIIGVEFYSMEPTGNKCESTLISKRVYLGSVAHQNETINENEREYYDALEITRDPASVEITKEKAQIIIDMLK